MATRVRYGKTGRANATTSYNGGIVVDGLADFNRALRRVSDEYPEAVKRANYVAASQVVESARGIADVEGGVARKASKSLRATRAKAYSAVVGGGIRAPYFFGAEFGAKRYRRFKSWRGNQWQGWEGGPGYFLHPAIRRDAPKILDEYMETLDALQRRAFPE